MTEIKGLEGYIAALREPEQWEAEDYLNPGDWVGTETWERWSSIPCSCQNQRWRRKQLSTDDRCSHCKEFDKDGCPNCGPDTIAKVF